ncbi:PilW family protein [Ramlibacter sp.]|uniref:PilW family protein n=1 Tax=Ramlibacter sp. TaxID=1917967 RepID=UPI002FCAD4EA
MHRPPAFARTRQRGLTLIEFMVSVAIGMLIVAAMATLIADQSGARAEVDRSGRLIENGRYAVRVMAEEIQMAGYWGELSAAPAVPGALPDPCSVAVADLKSAMGLHVQGYTPNPPAAKAGYNPVAAPVPPAAPGCLNNLRPGTDILVVRRVDPDSSDVETAGAVDITKLANGANATRVFLQTGLAAAGSSFTHELDVGGNHAASFTLKKKDKTSMATVRKMVVRIFYVTDCSVCSGSNADTTPSLKMRELVEGPALGAAITLAEGVENLQVDYGVDTDGDGVPNGADVDGAAFALADWPNVMTVKLQLLVRSTETSPSYQDAKTYAMGTAGTTAATNDGFRRHAFVQSVRLVNPSARRLP